MIEKFTVSRDDSIYEAWPDVALTPSGRLVCVFAECTHHGDRSYACVMICDSTDRGRTWSPKRRLTQPTEGNEFWNCPRITQLKDGRLVVVVDRLFKKENEALLEDCRDYLLYSEDEGQTWTDPELIPARGIVPDKLIETPSGRWLVGCHHKDNVFGYIIQRCWWSDDQGKTWQGPSIIGRQEGLNLCEVSIVPMTDGKTLVAFMRENSSQGWDCYKAISNDNGENWSAPIRFPLPGCHRPVAGWLNDGQIMITHRFLQGGKGWVGKWCQNFFAALTDETSALASRRNDAWTRILPIDFDRSPKSDLGYSGWVQFDDGEIYIVHYIMDDAPKGQIRGYALQIKDFILPEAE